MAWVNVRTVQALLAERHYLGSTRRGIAWRDSFGVIVMAKPTSRRLPQDGSWLELVRWCLLGEKNAGSRQWKAVRRALHQDVKALTTIVSYSDPSAGHTGALYRACGWIHAPTWHRLRPPPTGNGKWNSDKVQAVKDRWVCPLRSDPRRAVLLAVKDESLIRAGAVGYVEP
jgi:hypothetical protein